MEILSSLERMASKNGDAYIEERRDILRRAAALLCKSKEDRCSIVQYLVGIPFTVFSKHSIKLGIALWLGVINENPRMEPRILAEIAQSWETTVRRKMGVFSDKLRYVRASDAYIVPSDKLKPSGPILHEAGVCPLREKLSHQATAGGSRLDSTSFEDPTVPD